MMRLGDSTLWADESDCADDRLRVREGFGTLPPMLGGK